MRRYLALTLFVSACGSASVDTVEPVEETPLAPPGGNAASGALATEPSDTSKTREAHPGTILRRDLHKVLAAGPAGVLAMVQTEPAREKGHFIGFRITAFVKETPEAIDLRTGDVLVAVNGKKIVSPDDYFRVFQELAVASELRFDLLRDGRPETISYSIVE